MAALKTTATRVSAGTASLSSANRFAARSGAIEVTPVMLPPGRARLCTSPVPTGSPGSEDDNGDSAGCRFGSLGRRRGRCDNHVHIAARQLGCQLDKPFHLSLSKASFNHDVLSLDPAEGAQFLQERLHAGIVSDNGCGCSAATIRSGTHVRHCCARAASGHSAGAATALPSNAMKSRRFHSITSSARASSVGGTVRPSALAVVRLMTRSNLVGCSTGMSAGFAPRRILST